MQVSDLTVEVRDKSLTRLGKVPDGLLRGTFTPVHNGVGSWSLDLPADHDLARALRVPGSGIVVTGRDDVLLSGPMTSPVLKASSETPRGLVTIGGVSDDVLLADALAWPQPSNANASTQTLSHDNRSGAAETVMRAYVNANIGPGAPAARRSLLAQRLTLAPDLARGAMTARSARFPVLGDLLAEIATLAGLGFRIVQRDAALVFEVYEIADRTRSVRLDVAGGSLTSQEVKVSPPGATRPIVLGQGQGNARTVVTRTNAIAQAAEVQWGRRIEVSKDQRNTDVLLELQQAGDEILAEQGFTATDVQAVPAGATSMPYPSAWREGDRVSVIVDGQETAATVSQATILVGTSGVLVGIGLGDVRGFDAAAALSGRVNDLGTRLSQLEREGEAASSFDAALVTSGRFDPARIPNALNGSLTLEGNGAYLRLAGGTSSNGVQRTVDGAVKNVIGLFDASTRITVGPGDNTYDASLTVRADGVLQHSVPGGGNLPIPHAFAFVTGVAEFSNANSATVTITWPSGRFNVAPGCGPSIRTTTALYVIGSCIAGSSSVTVTVRRVDGASVTASIAVGVIGLQMTPTSGTG